MAVLKGVLKEELSNSLRMKNKYEQALKRIAKGALASRVIKGHKYYYLAKRVGEKVNYEYIGKISDAKKLEYEDARKYRDKFKKLLSKVKMQIKFLKRSLRGKESV
jgi:hypothetical protein